MEGNTMKILYYRTRKMTSTKLRIATLSKKFLKSD